MTWRTSCHEAVGRSPAARRPPPGRRRRGASHADVVEPRGARPGG
jgi:hypothetical protein